MKDLIAAIAVDPALFAAERAADAGVMASLERNGDRPDVARRIDLRFKGDEARLRDLATVAGQLDLDVLQLVEAGGAGHVLDLSCRSDTREATIDALTRTALQIATRFGVTYDGWGCVATKA